jgi:hypothetical protein
MLDYIGLFSIVLSPLQWLPIGGPSARAVCSYANYAHGKKLVGTVKIYCGLS